MARCGMYSSTTLSTSSSSSSTSANSSSSLLGCFSSFAAASSPSPFGSPAASLGPLSTAPENPFSCSSSSVLALIGGRPLCRAPLTLGTTSSTTTTTTTTTTSTDSSSSSLFCSSYTPFAASTEASSSVATTSFANFTPNFTTPQTEIDVPASSSQAQNTTTTTATINVPSPTNLSKEMSGDLSKEEAEEKMRNESHQSSRQFLLQQRKKEATWNTKHQPPPQRSTILGPITGTVPRQALSSTEQMKMEKQVVPVPPKPCSDLDSCELEFLSTPSTAPAHRSIQMKKAGGPSFFRGSEEEKREIMDKFLDWVPEADRDEMRGGSDHLEAALKSLTNFSIQMVGFRDWGVKIYNMWKKENNLVKDLERANQKQEEELKKAKTLLNKYEKTLCELQHSHVTLFEQLDVERQARMEAEEAARKAEAIGAQRHRDLLLRALPEFDNVTKWEEEAPKLLAWIDFIKDEEEGIVGSSQDAEANQEDAGSSDGVVE